MLLEAVNRRLSRLHNEQKEFPDLLLIDGGKGQLSSAAKPLSAFPDPPMIISLAKKEETIFSPYLKKPVQLPPSHPVRNLVERIRDEAHRWVISYHRTVRGKQFKKSSLENIAGVGQIRARALLRKFGSVKRITAAPIEEVATVKGFSLSSAKKVLKELNK
jgi:excinuclease ABC subunit C